MMDRTGSWNLIASLGFVFVVVSFMTHALLDRSEEETLDTLIIAARETSTVVYVDLASEILQETNRLSELKIQNIPDNATELVKLLVLWNTSQKFMPAALGTPPASFKKASTLIGNLVGQADSERAVSSFDAAELGALRSLFEDIQISLEAKGAQSLASVRSVLVSRGQAKNAIFFVILTVASGLIIMTLLQNNWLLAANAKISENATLYSRLARQDALTGLANRLHFEETLAGALGNWSEEETLAVLALDLDGFKAVNDTLGHDGGDALLKSIAVRLKNIVKNLDGRNCVARTGGDEFVILLFLRQGVADPRRIASRICSELTRPFETEFGHIKVGGSVGYTVVLSQNSDPSVLLTEADLALMNAKLAGSGLARPFHSSMMEALNRRLAIETELDRAIEEGHIQPFYQPQFDMNTGRLIGAEALARWYHPELGQIKAEEFIPVAEASGDIVKLGKAILEKVCRDGVKMKPDLTVTVNVSMAQLLENDFLTFVRNVLADTGLPAHRLILEFREHSLLADPSHARHVLETLQVIGVQISLGDFGTGTASIRDVLQIPWNEIKVDRSLSIMDEKSGALEPIINVIWQIGNDIRSNLVVEGIETESQRSSFSAAGFTYGQGFFYSEALPLSDFERSYMIAS